jgi:very-short-patch-repair endonuclease
MNAFEADVHAALSARGIPLVPQLGVSSYRLDFAAADPAQPGRFVLAIECDGASYHSAPTARDRDRLRQQQLEALGWRFHRIWSTDWFLHREREIDAAVQAWEVALVTEEKPPEPTPEIPVAEAVERGEPPAVPKREDIEEVPRRQLDDLVRWVMAGGVRTDDEIVDEVAERLGYARVGAKINRTVLAAIARVRG